MYKELISELSKDIQWVKPQPPCSEEELHLAEEMVGLSFPEELKKLLREMNGDRWCLLSAEKIAENTENIRKDFLAFFEEEYGEEEYLKRVKSFLFFAGNGCGDYYCYRINPDGTVDDSKILIWEHERLGERCCWKTVALDLKDFITKYYNDEI